MTVAQRIGALEKNLELARQSGEFISLCRILLQSKGQIPVARQIAAEGRMTSPRVRDLIKDDAFLSLLRRGNLNPRGNPADQFLSMKAATSALVLDSGAFSTFELLVSGFVNALSSIGVFDGMRSSMRVVPVGRIVGSVTSAATGYVVTEGSVKPVSRSSLTNGILDPQKAHCVVTVANELLKFGGRDVDALLTKELINACTLAIDGSFLATLLAGVVVGTSIGSAAEAIRADLAVLLAAVPTDQTSKLFIITSPLICKMWAAMGSANGGPAFEDMTPQGGTIIGIPVIASDAVAVGVAGAVILVDANAIAAGSDTFVLTNISEGTIMPDTSPDSPVIGTTNVVSLWQSDLSALLVERWWGAEKLRAASVAALINGNSYQQGFSPP
jgi:HK97 family phage major capsid protein